MRLALERGADRAISRSLGALSAHGQRRDLREQIAARRCVDRRVEQRVEHFRPAPRAQSRRKGDRSKTAARKSASALRLAEVPRAAAVRLRAASATVGERRRWRGLAIERQQRASCRRTSRDRSRRVLPRHASALRLRETPSTTARPGSRVVAARAGRHGTVITALARLRPRPEPGCDRLCSSRTKRSVTRSRSARRECRDRCRRPRARSRRHRPSSGDATTAGARSPPAAYLIALSTTLDSAWPISSRLPSIDAVRRDRRPRARRPASSASRLVELDDIAQRPRPDRPRSIGSAE